ncbi:unnamed protein product [Durusdinium trenchii]|uniref:Uncharacterized protein n=1 Tax=Durusdinium trenchii TaxID=1381693 RepID=A0ABP0SJI3_9DINO
MFVSHQSCDLLEHVLEAAFLQVELCGSRGAAYDRYPPSWQNGKAPPNLETFAQELLAKPMGDVLVLGSRGGQVVLPRFWQRLGNQVPPAVVINGGCAMNLPGVKIPWPPQAVTIMLMGAQDFFKGQKSSAEYLTASKGHVPANSRTAILYVRQMQHMPSKALLQMVLGPLVMAAAMWKYSKNCPEESAEKTFGSSEESPRKKKSIKGEKEVGDPRSAELRALLKAAVKDVTPSGGSGFLRARTTSQEERLDWLLRAAADSFSWKTEPWHAVGYWMSFSVYPEEELSVPPTHPAAKELRKSANRQAKKALELESQIIEKEKDQETRSELHDLRQQLSKVRADR